MAKIITIHQSRRLTKIQVIIKIWVCFICINQSLNNYCTFIALKSSLLAFVFAREIYFLILLNWFIVWRQKDLFVVEAIINCWGIKPQIFMVLTNNLTLDVQRAKHNNTSPVML